MNLRNFVEEYEGLPPGEQSLFAEAVRRLLAEGLVWRGDENDRRSYSFLVRHENLVSQYLALAGWEVRHHERELAFHVVHVEGAHRRRLSRDTSMWLLLVRMLYAEERESNKLSFTRFPVISIDDLTRRYAEFFVGQVPRKKTSLLDALRTLIRLKLVRPAGGGALHVDEDGQLIELLPTLEIVLPSDTLTELVERLVPEDTTVNDDGRDAGLGEE